MQEKDKQFSISLFVLVGIVVSFLYLLAASWLRWGDLIADTSREFWLPLQLLEGKTLYKDVFYEYGLFPAYFLAGLYALFDVHVNVLAYCGIAITTLMVIFLYKIARMFLDTLISGLVALTFLFVLAFGYYYDWSGISNFVLPYSFASTFFILFVVLAVYDFLQFLLCEKRRYVVFWIMCMTLAMLSRIELSVMILAGFGFISAIHLLTKKSVVWWKWSIALVLPVVISVSVYTLFLVAMQAFDGFYTSIIQHILTLKSNPFNLRTTGFNDIPLNSFLMLKSFGVHGVIVGLLGLGSICFTRFFTREENTPFSLILGGGAVFAAFQVSNSQMTLNLQYRSLPLILVIGIGYALIQIIKIRETSRHLALLTLFVIALAAMARIVLNATCFGYGFFMLALGLIGYYLFFFDLLKQVSQKYHTHRSWTMFSFLLLCYFLLQISMYWNGSFAMYTQKNFPVGTEERGILFSWENEVSERFMSAIRFLQEHTPPDATVVAFPEGIGLNFFAQRENPSGFHSFTPPLCELIGEQNMIARLEKAQIDYIVIVHRLAYEYGLPSFGTHYGTDIYAWILDKYQLIELIGPYPFTSEEFGIAIFQRRREE